MFIYIPVQPNELRKLVILLLLSNTTVQVHCKWTVAFTTLCFPQYEPSTVFFRADLKAYFYLKATSPIPWEQTQARYWNTLGR